MKVTDLHVAIGAAILTLALPTEAKGPGGLQPLDVLHKRHAHHHNRAATSPRAEGLASNIEKRGHCEFPTDVGLVAVTPNDKNGGWAMSPDQCCEPGGYCPYACPPGQVMAQWNPKATSYTYPESMDGGLYCNEDGTVSKPFPNKPYCVDGTGGMGAQNNMNEVVAFCQTVLPGNEAMLIPTPVMEYEVLAVPGTHYWCETAAHYYINPPGISIDEACVWGSGDKPIGNWSPYVSGANTDAAGLTYVKIGWNPIYTGCDLSKTLPTFGIKVECHGDCVGMPCEIDPSVVGLNGVTSPDTASGAGGADFCVVTAQKGSTANIVIFEAGNSNGGPSSPAPAQSHQGGSSSQAPTSVQAVSSSTTSCSTISSTTTSTTSTTTSSTTTASSTTTYSHAVYPSGIVPQNGTVSNATVLATGGAQAPHTVGSSGTTPVATVGANSSASFTSASIAAFGIALFGALCIF